MTRRDRYWAYTFRAHDSFRDRRNGEVTEAERCTVSHKHEPERPRRAAPGSLLCRGCLERLRDTIAELPKLHGELDDVIVGDDTEASAGPISRIPGSSGPAGRQIAAAEHQKQIMFDLRAHARWVARERGLKGTSLDGPQPLARWLDPHVEWMARQHEPENVVEAFRMLRGKAMALIDPRPRTEFAVAGDDGRCLEVLDGVPCPGRLWVSGVFGDAASFEVICTDCARAYDSTQLMRLGVRIDHRRQQAPAVRVPGRLASYSAGSGRQ